MDIERLIPVSLGVVSSVVATALYDINWGGVAAAIGTAGATIGGALWNISRNKTKAYAASEAAKLKVFEDSEAAKLKVFRDSEAAKLKVLRAAEAARMEIQKQQDDANKVSLSARVKELETKLDQKRKLWHEEANRQTGLFMKMEAQLWEAKLRVAKLEGQLGITDKLHAAAINANAENINIVAEKTGVPLAVHPPHVDPIAPSPPPDGNHEVLDPSDDDLSAFLQR